MNIVSPRILEVGTGSGCISITLKKEIDCAIDAIDISDKAIELAQENARDNRVRINCKVQNIENFILKEKYDLIISNPPYVPFNSSIDAKIKYEPQGAIFAPEQGIYYYRIILEKISQNLAKNFLIAFEIGDKQGAIVKNLILKYLPNTFVNIERDYNNYERYVFATNIEKIFED